MSFFKIDVMLIYLGLEYHQQGVFDPPKLKYKTCIKISNIDKNRFKDLAFWSTLFTMWLKESEYHRIEVRTYFLIN
jgi:hypothetical protein